MDRIHLRANQLLLECEKAIYNTNMIKELAQNYKTATDVNLREITDILKMLDGITYPVVDYNIRMELIDNDFKSNYVKRIKWEQSISGTLSQNSFVYESPEIVESLTVDSNTDNTPSSHNDDNLDKISINTIDNSYSSQIVTDEKSNSSKNEDKIATNVKIEVDCDEKIISEPTNESMNETLILNNSINSNKIITDNELLSSNQKIENVTMECKSVKNCSRDTTIIKEIKIDHVNKKKDKYKNRRHRCPGFLDDQTKIMQKETPSKSKKIIKNKSIEVEHSNASSTPSQSPSLIITDELSDVWVENRCGSGMTNISLNWDDITDDDIAPTNKQSDVKPEALPQPRCNSTIKKEMTYIDYNISPDSEMDPEVYQDALCNVYDNVDNSGSDIELLLSNNANDEVNKDVLKMSKDGINLMLPVREEIFIDDSFNCLIIYAENPSSFYVIPSIYADQHNSLTHKMNSYYQNKEEFFKTKRDIFNSGLLYFAIKGYDDDMWCRTILKNPLEDSETIEMFCIDFGITITLSSTSTVFPLHKDFYKYPPMAYHCSLDLIEPTVENWANDAKAYMNNYIYTPCSVIVSNIIDDILCVYVLSDDDVVFNMDLVLRGIACFKADSNLKNNQDEPISHYESDNSEADLHFEDVLGADINVAFEGHDMNDEKIICRNYRGQSDNTCYKGSSCKKAHIPFKADGSTVEKSVILTIPDMIFPKTNSPFNVKVTTIINYKTFYMQFLSTIGKIENDDQESRISEFLKIDVITSAMNNPNAIKLMKHFKIYPSIGEYIACKIGNGKLWVRGIICSLSANHAEVFLIDYGSTEEVKYENIRKLHKSLMIYARQSIRCTLHNVKSACDSKMADAKMKFAEICFNNSMIAKVKNTEYECGMFSVSLYSDTNIDVSETLHACKYVELDSEDHIPKIIDKSVKNTTKKNPLYIPG